MNEWVAVWLVFLAYFLPVILAWIRKVPNTGSIAVINVFLGWTFVGWVVALAMACRSVPPVVVGRDRRA